MLVTKSAVIVRNCVRTSNVTRFTGNRLIHGTTFLYKNDNEIPPLKEEDDGKDTLQDLYKKKYEFIQKQNLEESYNQLNESNENANTSNNYGDFTSSSSSSSANDKTFQLTQRIKLLVAGLAALITTVGGLEVYSNWNNIKSKYFGDTDLESFDEMYERIKEKKQKKIDALNSFSKTITNPNDTSVPGVYICGDNEHHLVNDESFDYIPVFKRLDVFDNFVVKDIFLGDNSGALIDDRGDLYQWGDGFKGDSTKPSIKGKKLTKVQISNGTVYALSSSGEVFYLPESSDLQSTVNGKEKGWFGVKTVNFLTLSTPKKNIVDIAAGLEHLALLDKEGSVFTTATGYQKEIEKSFGQFGLPEFSQFDEPPKINEVHDVVLLNKYMKKGEVLRRKTKQIATGDYFTLCLDQSGTVWAFGRNTHGAIGSRINYDTEIIPYPTQVKFISSLFKRNEFPQCIEIAAGGETAYATFKSSNMYELFEKSIREKQDLTDVNIDILKDNTQSQLYLSWGHGLKGELGLGHFIHGTHEPKKIKVLNDIKEFNEETNKLEKLGIKSWSIGKNHAIATLENSDVYVWGDNEFGQLGNGKRIRSGAPDTIPAVLEPDFESKTRKYAKYNNRLQLSDNGKIHQEIVAGRTTTAIVYKRD